MSEKDEKKQDEPGASNEDEGRFHRRGFFREGFRQFLKPFAELVEDRLERVGVPGDEDYPSAGGPPPYPTAEVPDGPVLRPPGALPEEEFLDRCLSSGQCVNACPVSAIKFARSDDPRLDEKPFIDADMQACVVCEDLSCMSACPSGALDRLTVDEIRMGTAELRDEICVRTQGEDCQICVDKCPIGASAIEIPYEGGAVAVHEKGCTGCGVCQMECPTEPRAIVVRPDRGGDAYGSGSYGDGAAYGEGASGSYFGNDETPPD